MPFLSRRRLRWMGKRTYKHNVIGSALGSAVATTIEHTLAEGVDSPALATPTDVASISRVNLINFDLNIAPDTSNERQIVDWYFAKKLPGQTLPAANAVGTSNLKSQIFQQGRECLNGTGNVAKRVGIIRVPPKYARVNDGEKIVFAILNSQADATNTWTYCFTSIYKEIRA